MIVIDTNVKVKASGQYNNFDYNSMVKFGDKFLCASESGLFELTGTTDNGTAITSYFEPMTMDFGISNEKRLRNLYISYEANGNLTLTITTEKGDSDTYTLTETVAGQKARTIKINRKLHGRYWTFNISGTCQFSIDEIKVIPVIRSHGLDQN